MPEVTLAYWSIRGLAQPIRLLLGYTKTDFEDKVYVCGNGPEYDRSCWFDVKYSIGLDFPNLPYLIDGDLKISQSGAIIRHIARKHNMVGETDKEKSMIDMLELELKDFSSGFTGMCYRSPDPIEEAVEQYKKNVKSKLKSFEDFLGDKKFLIGDKLTYVDFMMYELLDQHTILQSDIFNEYPKLKEYLDRFEALPEIAEFMKSEKFVKRPHNNKMAKVGGKL